MVVEKSFKKATLTGQTGNEDLILTIVPHPAVSGCALLTILSFEKTINVQITVNNSELKKVADMLCIGVGAGVGVDLESS